MEMDCLQRNDMFKFKITLDHHNARQKLIYCLLPDPPLFSLPSTFKMALGSFWISSKIQDAPPLSTTTTLPNLPPVSTTHQWQVPYRGVRIWEKYVWKGLNEGWFHHWCSPPRSKLYLFPALHSSAPGIFAKLPRIKDAGEPDVLLDKEKTKTSFSSAILWKISHKNINLTKKVYVRCAFDENGNFYLFFDFSRCFSSLFSVWLRWKIWDK
jgi:hypothetical protein